MRSIVQHVIIILGMVWSFDAIGYSENSDGKDDVYRGKSGSHNAAFIGEYAGHLGAGKGIGELQSFGEHQSNAEQGNQHEQSGHNDAYGQQADGGQKYDNNQYEGFGGDLDISKFPPDVEAYHYTGGGESERGLDEENYQHQEHGQKQYEDQRDYQSDDQNVRQPQESYNPYVYKQDPYKGYDDPVGMLIVPYSGYQPEEKQDEQQPQHYSGYEGSQQSNNNYEQPQEPYSKAPSVNYETPKESYGSSYEITKVPVSSYRYESERAPSLTYSSSYQPVKATSPEPILNEIQENHGDYTAHGNKYQYSPMIADSPAKQADFIQNIKLDNLKNFHAGAQQNVMTIDHSRGSFSYSSVYRA